VTEALRAAALKRKKLLSWTGAALIAGLLAVGNFAASYFPIRLDLSQGRVYSLSKGTKDLLKTLDDPVVVRIIFSPDLPPQFKLNEQYIRDLLREYQKTSHGRVRLEYIDPSVSLKVKQEAISAGVFPVQLDVIEKDKREIKECFMGLALLYGDKKESISFIQDTSGLEYEITQRIKKLIQPKQVRLGFATAGRALGLDSDALKPLAQPIRQIYETVDVDLAQPIPADIKSLWLIGPTEALDAKSIDGLRTFVQNGGVLGLLIDNYSLSIETFRPNRISLGMDDLLKEWGVEFKPALVVDPVCDRIQIRSTQGFFSMINVIDYPYFPLATDLNREHPALKLLDAVSFAFVSPLLTPIPVEGLTYTPLAKSSPKSWLDSQAASASPLQQHQMPDGAQAGPFNLGLMIEGKFKKDAPDAPVGRVLLFGCSRFIRTDYPPRQSNFNMFFNLLDWSNQDEFLLAIRSKGIVHRPLKTVSDMIRPVLKIFLIAALPILSLILGLIVWRYTRRRLSTLPALYPPEN
jgi:ABC-type uncharacterized transport system involved in gliding motility auxiliary subunit